MRIKTIFVAAVAALMTACTLYVRPAAAQVVVDVEPVCVYGYYEFPPYDCAPQGYWDESWFIGGVFIGVGPWFERHGHARNPVWHHPNPRGPHGPGGHPHGPRGDGGHHGR